MKRFLILFVILGLAIPAMGANVGIKQPKVTDWTQLNKRLQRIERFLGQNQGTSPSTQKAAPQTQDEFAESLLTGGVEQVENPVVAVMSDRGAMELYDVRTGERVDIVLPATARVHKTLAAQAIPSSYFLDLRAHNNSTTVRHITADWATLHDNSSPWKVIGLADIDVTNSIATAGPIAEGRDQVAAFAQDSWINFFIIYNSTTGEISSLSSVSATAPTLPTGYDYFVRSGPGRVDASWHITTGAQLGDRVHQFGSILYDGEPTAADYWDTLDISNWVPPTAKSIFGYFGLTTDTAANPGMAVRTGGSDDYQAEATLSIAGGYASWPPGTVKIMKSATYFHLVMTVPQEIYWRATVKNPRYGLTVHGWIDDL